MVFLISREIIEDYEEGMGMDAIAVGADDARDISPMQEQKLKQIIKTLNNFSNSK